MKMIILLKEIFTEQTQNLIVKIFFFFIALKDGGIDSHCNDTNGVFDII